MGVAVCDTLRVFHVGDVIRKLRQAQGLGVKELAEKSKLNKGTVSAVERGESFKKETIEALAAALGVRVGQLYAPLSNVQSVTINDGEYDGTGFARADAAHTDSEKTLTYSDRVSSVQRSPQPRSAGGPPDVAPPSSRIHELTSALLTASAGFETLATKCQEYRAAISAVTGAQVAINSGLKPKPAKSNRGHSRSRAGVQRSRK